MPQRLLAPPMLLPLLLPLLLLLLAGVAPAAAFSVAPALATRRPWSTGGGLGAVPKQEEADVDYAAMGMMEGEPGGC